MVSWSLQISSELGHLWNAYSRYLRPWLNIYLLLARTSEIHQKSSLGSSHLFSEHMPGSDHPILSIHKRPPFSQVFSSSAFSFPGFSVYLFLAFHATRPYVFLCPRQLWVICVFKHFDRHQSEKLLPPKEGKAKARFYAGPLGNHQTSHNT